MGTIKRHPVVTAIVAVVGIGLAAYLAFGVFGIHTLFTTNKVDEAGPTFSSAPSAVATPASSDAPAASEAPAPATPTITTVAQGTFSGADAEHNVAGDALVLTDGSDQRVLRLENFEATNGPDLKVYLRADNGDYVSLGALKGNVGDQNYDIPADLDLSAYSEVQIWCERFAVNFGSAELA